MTYKDYYKILGLTINASTNDIKKAYRKLAMQYHPDLNHGKEEWANEKFKEINEAFSVLGDPQKRSQHDNFGAVGDISDIFSSKTTRTSFEDLINDLDGAGVGFEFLDNIFSDTFRGTGFAFQNHRRGFGGHRGMRFEADVDINLEDVFEQSQSSKLFIVNYEIVLSKEQAFNGMEKELVRNGKRLKVKIPAGVKTGSRIRLRNALNTTDGERGDIIISIKVK